MVEWRAPRIEHRTSCILKSQPTRIDYQFITIELSEHLCKVTFSIELPALIHAHFFSSSFSFHAFAGHVTGDYDAMAIG